MIVGGTGRVSGVAAGLVLFMAAWGCSQPIAESVGQKEHTALVSAGRVAYAMTGNGEDVLFFLHDLGSEKGIWREFAASVQWQGRIVLMDLRGHGNSESPGDGDYSVGAAALDVVGLAERLEAQRVVLVGHGWGAQVALKAARLAGAGRVRGVVLVDPMPEMSQLDVAAMRGFLEGVMAPKDSGTGVALLMEPLLDGLSEAQRQRVLKTALNLGRGKMVSGYQGMFSHRAAQDVQGYRGALLAVVGDANMGPLALHHVAEDLPYRVIAGKGHFLMLTAAAELGEALNVFLALLQAD